jgi:hypothetical protein
VIRRGDVLPWIGALSMIACAPVDDDTLECPAWTAAQGDRCVLRSWVLPDPGDALSEPGAREVQVALGTNGEALVAWTDADPVDGRVFVAERDGASWSTMPMHVAVDDAGSVGLEPAIAIGPTGEALVAWKQQRDDGAVFLAARSSAGAWTMPTAPVSWAQTAYEPRVAFGPDGEAFVLWNQWTGTNFGVALGLRAPGSESFVLPDDADAILSAPVNYANAPRLAVGPGGEALIAWYQAPVDDLMVYVSERRDGGAPFTRATADGFVSPGGATVDSHTEANATPVLGDAGEAAVVWTQQRGEPWDIAVFAATRTTAGQWRRPSSLDDTISTPGAFARCPQAAFVDGALVVTWYETRGDDTAVWIDHGDGAGPVRLSPDGVEAVHPVLGVDAAHGLVVVWVENDADSRDTWRVVARRRSTAAAGAADSDIDAARWLPPEVLSVPQAGLAPTPQLAVAPDDGAVLVAWAQGGVLDGRVYVATLP